jgi:phage protein D
MSDSFSDITADITPVNNAVQGTILRVKICVENWDREGDYDELDCGAFEIDSVDYSGPPDKVAIKAVSTPISTGMRREEKSRAWEDTTLQKIAQDMADSAGLKLMYEVENDIQLDRVDQLQESDMAFLMELCDQYGISLKVTSDTVVLFDESVYEAGDIIDTFNKNEVGGRLINYSFSQNTGDTVSKAVSSYKDPKSGQLVEAEFEPPEPPATGQVALINARPGDLRGDNFRNGVDTASDDSGGTFDTGFRAFNGTADDFGDIRSDKSENAMKQAKAAARKKNKGEWICTLKMVGHVHMIGGVNIRLTGFGVYSGKYSVDEATHSVGGGYVSTVKAHKVLVGY